MGHFEKAWIVGVVSWGALACGSDPSTFENEEDARLAYAAISAQLSLIALEIEDGTGTAEIACEGGGTSKMTSSTSAEGTSLNGSQNSEFSNCVVGDLTMDGEMTATVSSSSSGGTMSISARSQGTVTFTGHPEGICHFDISLQGSSGSPSGGTFSGTMCGFPAEDVLNGR